MSTTLHNLGDQHIRIERFDAFGLPCIKEVIVRRVRSDEPKTQQYFYVDTAKVPLLTSSHRDKLKKTCKSMDELVGIIEALGK